MDDENMVVQGLSWLQFAGVSTVVSAGNERKRFVIVLSMLILSLGMIACGSTETRTTNQEHSEEVAMSRGEHARDSSEGKEIGEESGTQLSREATYDHVRNGAHLILNYDPESNSFVGSVENTTEEMLKRVRVEVHLSNGIELGPTSPVDLAPGEKSAVSLKASEADFEGWVAHPEVGSGEAGHDENGGDRNEHSPEGKGEHSRPV